MPENLIDTDIPTEPTGGRAAAYQQVLDDPETPLALAPDLHRVARTENVGLAIFDSPETIEPVPAEPLPSLHDLTSAVRQRSDKMFAEPTFNYGMSYFNPDEKVRRKLQSGEYSEEELVAYIREAKVLCDAFDTVAQARNEFSDGSRYEGVLHALSSVPLDKMRTIYHSIDASENLRHMLERVKGPENVRDALMFIQRMHGQEDILDLWGNDSPVIGTDPTFHQLIGKGNVITTVASTLEVPASKWPEGTDPMTETKSKLDWADRYLERLAGLPEDIRTNLLFNAYTRTMNEETGMLNSRALRALCERAASNALLLGPEQTTLLRKKAGIASLDYYAAEQLRLMAGLLEDNSDIIRHLQEGDVSVVFTNAKGDYNGALGTVTTNYATETNRTLFFEIHQPSDFYRYMLLLHKKGVKASTLVFAAHGLPGNIPVHGNNGGLGIISNNTKKRRLIDRLPGMRTRWERAQAINNDISQSRGLARVIRDMMQDSRGIDDNEEATGRRRIILNACLSDAEVEVRRPGLLNKARRFFDVPAMESLAKTVTKVINQQNLDVYANEEAFAAEPTKDWSGVRHFIEERNHLGVKQRRELRPTHYSLDSRGHIRSRRITYIPLRNLSDAKLAVELQAA